jgi:hypothetical protein
VISPLPTHGSPEFDDTFPPTDAYAFEDTHMPVESAAQGAPDMAFARRAPIAEPVPRKHPAPATPAVPISRTGVSATAQKARGSSKRRADVRVIGEREESSMVSCWTIYLCLQIGDSKPFRVFNGRWSECLGEREEYPYNEKTEEFKIPKKIRGIKVEVVDDEWILGGDLIWENSTDAIEFEKLQSAELGEWLKANKWSFEAIKAKLGREMKSLGSKRASRAPKQTSSRRRSKK